MEWLLAVLLATAGCGQVVPRQTDVHDAANEVTDKSDSSSAHPDQVPALEEVSTGAPDAPETGDSPLQPDAAANTDANGSAAACQPGGCDDGNPCTDDGCSPAIGCTHEPNTQPCDDGNACSAGDVCSNGQCVSGPTPKCDDANACTDDGCDKATGCTNSANSLACDDGNVCTTKDACSGSQCVGGPPQTCDDGNACTDDPCDMAKGCTTTANTAACDDGNACTTQDGCWGGKCVGGPVKTCDDGNTCTLDTCESPMGVCKHVPVGAGVPCAGGKCTDGTCVACKPKCVFGTCGADDGCGGSCGCPVGAFCLKGLCTDKCPVGAACTPDAASCYLSGTYASLGDQCGCLPSPTSQAPDGTFCDGSVGLKACNDGNCLSCKPPYGLEDGQQYSGTALNFLDLGIGIDTAGNNIRGTCIDVSPPGELCAGAVASSNIYVSVVTESKALDSALHVDTAAHYGGVGVYDAKASFSQTQMQSIRTDSAFLVLSMEVTWNTGGKLSSVALKPDKLELAKKDPVGFVLGCGDQYVDSAVTGGYFRIVYHFKGVSAASKKELSASFSGKSVNWKVDANFTNSVQEMASKYETELWLFKSGASPAKLSLTLPELISQAKCFTDSSAPGCAPADLLTCKNAKAIAMHTTPYQATVGWPPGLALPSTAKQRKIRNSTAEAALKATYALNDVAFRLEHQSAKLKALPECTGELQKLMNHKAALTFWLDKADGKIEACSKAYLCGPSLTCTAELPPLPPLDLPLMATNLVQTCGPICASGAGVKYEIDAFGYCTRCDFDLGKSPDWFGFNGVKNGPGPSKFNDLACNFMRPGSTAKLDWCGKMQQAVSKGIGMYGLWLQANSDGNGGTCSWSYDQTKCSGYFDGWQGQPNPWWYALTNSVLVSSSGGKVAANLHLLSCTGNDAHCWAEGMKVSICDANVNPNCGTSCQ